MSNNRIHIKVIKIFIIQTIYYTDCDVFVVVVSVNFVKQGNRYRYFHCNIKLGKQRGKNPTANL